MPHRRLEKSKIHMPDLIVSLVDPKSLDSIMNMPMRLLIEGMESRSLRTIRPDQIPPSRQFDVDLEGEVLEWIDENPGLDVDYSLREQNIPTENKLELLLLMCHWASSVEWRCWDARLFLYIEPILDYEVKSTESFLSPSLWKDFSTAISSYDRSSFVESVVMDWMSRRESLGETMDPSSDPRILPTMESHQIISGSLFDIIEGSRLEGNSILLGREYLEARSWHLGDRTLEDIIG